MGITDRATRPPGRDAPATASKPHPSEHSFGASAPFTVGAEEELFLADPVTGRMVNSSAAVTEHLAAEFSGVERELHAGMVEFVTDVCAHAGEVIEQLAQRRVGCLKTGVGLLGSGVHPTATDAEVEISDKERYERISRLLGDAVAVPVAGLHVHVGMPDPETAVKVFNTMRVHLPLLAALAANSPFRHSHDTGLASARGVIIRNWPRSGVPRALEDWRDFCDLTDLLTKAAGVDDYTWFWWKLRPHPKLGTVEIRAFDSQSSLADTEALVALTHCLARAAADTDPVDNLPSELLEEGLFRGSRFGVRAELPDATGNLHPFERVVERALADAAPYARELSCERALAQIPALVAAGGGAGRQRAVCELAGIDALLRDLTERTARPAGISRSQMAIPRPDVP